MRSVKKEFTRETFKKIKKMDRKTMEDFLLNLFDDAFSEGYKAGKTEAETGAVKIDLNKLEDEVLKIKGIGVVKAAEIKKVVKDMIG